MSIGNLLTQLNSIEELQSFAEHQFHAINKLTQENEALKKQIEILKGKQKQLEASQPSSNLVLANSEPDDKTIAEVQLRILKEMSFGRELTRDETSRVETYSKILNEHRKTQKKTIEVIPASTTDEELIKMLEQK